MVILIDILNQLSGIHILIISQVSICRRNLNKYDTVYTFEMALLLGGRD
jgi:hypothetical protein